MKFQQMFGVFGLTIMLLLVQTRVIEAGGGYWELSQLSIQFASHPSINNSEEIVWASQGGGIFSNVRGQLAESGLNPHLANSGEVVYADWFGGPNWDLVSTTRGQLTQGGIIDINASDFDVNTNGEVVYVVRDTNNIAQVYSTIRGQITFDATDHSNPCINDRGEIVWNQYLDGIGVMAVSSNRGILPGFYPSLNDLNNSGEFCYSGNLAQSGNYSFPHIFSSAHGVIINDFSQYQWGGSINDVGTIVWVGQNGAYEAKWAIAPTISVVPELAGFALEWSTNSTDFHVQYTTNGFSASVWQSLSGNPMTNGANFHLTIRQNLGNAVFFRLSNVSP